jgi:hypothetical protein
VSSVCLICVGKTHRTKSRTSRGSSRLDPRPPGCLQGGRAPLPIAPPSSRCWNVAARAPDVETPRRFLGLGARARLLLALALGRSGGLTRRGPRLARLVRHVPRLARALDAREEFALPYALQVQVTVVVLAEKCNERPRGRGSAGFLLLSWTARLILTPGLPNRSRAAQSGHPPTPDSLIPLTFMVRPLVDPRLVNPSVPSLTNPNEFDFYFIVFIISFCFYTK